MSYFAKVDGGNMYLWNEETQQWNQISE